MKRVKVPGIVNIFKVSEPEEIAALAQDSRIDREFRLRTCPIDWLLLRRWLSGAFARGAAFSNHDAARFRAAWRRSGKAVEFSQ